MSEAMHSTISRLVSGTVGEAEAERTLRALAIAPAFRGASDGRVTRAAFSVALNAVLFADLLARVPNARRYVDAQLAQDSPITFDHGALRTIRFAEGPTGALPPGQEAFARILAPLGYAVAGLYPLPALRMTGRAWCHLDHPQTIPQFFVSELHVEQFDDGFAEAAHHVFDGTRDPLDAAAVALLARFADGGEASFDEAAAGLPAVAAAFGCHHAPVTPEDYETLRAQSAEAAWIATEGNAFNHATDRVPDVLALAAELTADGYPMKDRVEVSTNGRVRQTAMRADPVARRFADGAIRQVPGSFYEFISRDTDPDTGVLDLTFDSGNATGIFAMTRAA